MTLPNFTTLTRDEALAFILSGMQAKRAEIDATLYKLRENLQFLTDPTAPIREMRERYLPKRRKLSRAARKAISDAQKRRWAKVRG